MERYSDFNKLKETRSLKPENKVEAKLLEKEIVAFIELLKKSVVVEKKDEGDNEKLKNKAPQNGK